MAGLQESEGEEAASSRVVLAQDMGRGNMASRQSRVLLQEVRVFRLPFLQSACQLRQGQRYDQSCQEVKFMTALPQIGPRLELEIVKVEDGMCSGTVLYHSHVKKSPAEAAAQEKAIKARDDLRKQRRNQQVRPDTFRLRRWFASNVVNDCFDRASVVVCNPRRLTRTQEANVKRKANLKRKKEAADSAEGGGGVKKRKKEWWDQEPHGRQQYEEDDDAEYYRQEVGHTAPLSAPGANAILGGARVE